MSPAKDKPGVCERFAKRFAKVSHVSFAKNGRLQNFRNLDQLPTTYEVLYQIPAEIFGAFIKCGFLVGVCPWSSRGMVMMVDPERERTPWLS